jgi:hypothetical protein
MSKSKKAKREGLERHRQMLREKKLKTFIEKRGKSLEKVSFILPPKALFPDLGEPLRDTRSGFRKFLVMLPELPRLLAKP